MNQPGLHRTTATSSVLSTANTPPPANNTHAPGVAGKQAVQQVLVARLLLHRCLVRGQQVAHAVGRLQHKQQHVEHVVIRGGSCQQHLSQLVMVGVVGMMVRVNRQPTERKSGQMGR